MKIYYKKETSLTTYVKSIKETTLYKEAGWLEKIGFKSVKYPDIYFHTGVLNYFSNNLIKNSKCTIVNSSILKDSIVQTLGVDKDNIQVIYPAVDVEKFKKKELKEFFYKQYNIDNDKRIIYFTAKNYKKSGFDSFCNIITKLESENYKVVISTDDEKELIYAKDLLKQHELLDDTLIVDNEIFGVADVFVLPTSYKNFSINILKAMANKCVAFVPQTNYAVELVDVFSVMKEENDLNTAYKIDMVLRVPDELKKIQKENYSVGKRITTAYQHSKLDKILKELDI